MNEELKIIIKAVTDEAKKNISAVKKELQGVETEGKDVGKTLDAAMKGVAKGAAVAIGSIAALTAAMVKLGQSAQDINKGFSKMKSSFENAGSSAKEATKYYKELFGIIGEHDRTVETGQSLARITTDEGALSDYKNIMAGAISQYGDGYNTEALAENISETIAAAKVTGDLERVLVEAGISADGFNAALAATTSTEERELLIRNTLNGVLGNAGRAYIQANQGAILLNQSQANLNITLAQAAGYTTPLLTAINNLGASLLTFLAPALQTVAVYLTGFIQLMAEAIQWVGGFFGMFSSSTETATADVEGYRNAMNNYLSSLGSAFGSTNNELDKNLDKINAVKKATMGFDELNVVSKPTSVGGIGGGGGGTQDILSSLPQAPNPADFGIGTGSFDFNQMISEIEEAKEKLTGLLTLAGVIGGTFALWKITDFLMKLKESHSIVKKLVDANVDLDESWNFLSEKEIDAVTHLDKVKAAAMKIGGYILIIGGALLAIKGYTDAWANGVDWGNFALMVGGAAIACAGLYLAMGPLAASIGAVAAGIALIVIGVKDFIDNGATLQNTILIIGGAIAIAVGVATMGLGPLVGAIVGVVAAVAAFTAALILEKPAIMSVEEAQEALTAAKEKATAAENGYINAVDAAERAQNRLAEAEKKAGMTGAELFAQVQAGVLDYANMTAEQRELYKAYLDNEQKQKDLEAATKELTDAKKAETIASFENQLALAKESGNYEEYKNSVIDAFNRGEISADEARRLIELSMSEMSDSAQQSFMQDIPGAIMEGLNPHKYESTGTKLKKWFIKAGEDISTGFQKAMKNMANGVISFLNLLIRRINEKFSFSWEGLTIAGKEIYPGGSVQLVRIPEIPKLATGGIVTSSTLANIGEKGAEAVLPLENNTGWMDILADKIAARQGGSGTPIILQVDGKTFAQTTVRTVNDLTKQTGRLQLNIV